MLGPGTDGGERRADDVLDLRDDAARLAAQIRWFNRLRAAAAAAMLIAAFLAWGFAWVEDVLPLFALSALAFTVDAGYVAWMRRRQPKAEVRALRRHVDLQIGIDLAILTALLHQSGGVTNPLVLMFLFHTFIAAFLISVRAALLVGAVSVALTFGLAFGEYSGIIPHRPLRVGLFDLTSASPLALASWLSTLALVLGLSIYFVSTIVDQLRKRDRTLVGLSRQLALSEKLASIGTLAAGVSHEINNPVGVIRTKAKVLRYRIADGDAPELLLAELDAIEKHTKRIEAITAGLLTFSRETPFELRPVSINELVEEGVDLVRVPYKTAELGLDLRLDPRGPEVAGSVNHLLQVLVNVLLNAKDASAPGTRVSVSTTCSEEDAQIRIADQGTGIDARCLGKIFDPFFTTKDVDRGTGLGLALSHGIVERHGGRIEVESRVGEGSVFTIVLPRRVEG
jgi:signal transduction histidine kinase